MKSIDKKKKIILDADVIIHFYKGDHLRLLTQIYSNKLFIVKDVLIEILKGKLRFQIENAIRMKLIGELDITSDFKVFNEYARLKKQFGLGESASMAYCKYNNDVLASSNLKDIKKYCEDNNIQYLTTLDFINTAFEKNLLNESDCDYFIYNVITKGSKLPFNTIAEYRKSIK